MSETKTITIVLSYTDGKLTGKSKTETLTKENEDAKQKPGFNPSEVFAGMNVQKNPLGEKQKSL